MFDKQRIDSSLQQIANKSPTKDELILYRGADRSGSFQGWRSFSTVPGQYDKAIWKAFKIKPGAPLIFADGIADENEVIANVEKLLVNGLASEIPYNLAEPTQEFLDI